MLCDECPHGCIVRQLVCCVMSAHMAVMCDSIVCCVMIAHMAVLCDSIVCCVMIAHMAVLCVHNMHC